MQRFPQPDATLVPEETAFQIQLVSFSVRRLELEDRLITVTGQAQLQHSHDCTGDVVLDSKHVLHLAVEPLRPEAETVGDLDELGGDAELGVHPAEAAFQHRLHTEGISDLADVFVAAFERKARRPRRHTQPFDPRQSVQQILTDPVAQKLVLAIGAHVHEREHGDRSLLFAAGLARRSRPLPLARSRLPDFWPEDNAIHLHRPLDVLQLDLADAREWFRDFVVYVIEHLLGDRDPTRLGQRLDPRGNVHAVAHNVIPPAQHIAEVNANSNLQLSVFRSAQVAPGQRLLEFDRAFHRGHRTGKLNQKGVAYRFYLLSLMFEERGPQERAVFLEQFQRQPLVALRQRAVTHHVGEHDRGELALFGPFDSHLSRHQPDDQNSRLRLPLWTSLCNAEPSA